MKPVKLLLLEDNEETAELLQSYLVGRNFLVETVFTVTDAISTLFNDPFDLLLLDLNLPDFDGYEVLKQLKGRLALPVIVVSAYSDTASKIAAFNYGATDYVVKPVDLEELEARIWVQLGLHSHLLKPPAPEALRIEGEDVVLEDDLLGLTPTEFQIFKIFLENKNRVVSRKVLTDALSSFSSERSLDNHIKNIRKKLGKWGEKAPRLKTEYGVGYRLITE